MCVCVYIDTHTPIYTQICKFPQILRTQGQKKIYFEKKHFNKNISKWFINIRKDIHSHKLCKGKPQRYWQLEGWLVYPPATLVLSRTGACGVLGAAFSLPPVMAAASSVLNPRSGKAMSCACQQHQAWHTFVCSSLGHEETSVASPTPSPQVLSLLNPAAISSNTKISPSDAEVYSFLQWHASTVHRCATLGDIQCPQMTSWLSTTSTQQGFKYTTRTPPLLYTYSKTFLSLLIKKEAFLYVQLRTTSRASNCAGPESDMG